MTETQFHGFNMLVNSKSIYEIVIWLFMLLLCTFFTVYQTISLISLYRSEPTMSVITVNQRGTFTSRDTQICFTWDMETDTLITELSAIDYLLSNVTNFTISQLQTERVNPNLFEPQLFRLILAMLFDITMHEAHTFGFQRSLVGKPIWGFTKYKSDYQLNSALYRVHQFFAEKKVSLKELMSATSSIACQVFFNRREVLTI